MNKTELHVCLSMLVRLINGGLSKAASLHTLRAVISACERAIEELEKEGS